MTERGDRVRVTSRTGSARRFLGDLMKFTELKFRHQTRRIDFWSSQTRGELAPYVSPPCVETFNSKVIKKDFLPEQTSRYVFSNFEIPIFFIWSVVMNIICLFRTWLYSCIWLCYNFLLIIYSKKIIFESRNSNFKTINIKIVNAHESVTIQKSDLYEEIKPELFQAVAM